MRLRDLNSNVFLTPLLFEPHPSCVTRRVSSANHDTVISLELITPVLSMELVRLPRVEHALGGLAQDVDCAYEYINSIQGCC